MIPNEILVEVSIRIRCTIRRNEKVCSCKHRSPLLHQLDLHRPLAEPGRNCCRIFLRICTVNRPAVFTCFSCSGILLSGRLFCLPLVLFYRLLIVRQRLPLHKRNRICRTDRQAVTESVAVVIPDQLCLPVNHRNRTFMTGMRTKPASCTSVFLYLNNFSNHH